MIKVTYKGKSVFEYDSILSQDNEYIYFLKKKERKIEQHRLSRVIKVEKQVKDLTKEEIYKYAISKYAGEIKHIDIYADCISIELNNGKFITLLNEDYIDITEIVKGDSK